jgi:hypothetical protein
MRCWVVGKRSLLWTQVQYHNTCRPERQKMAQPLNFDHYSQPKWEGQLHAVIIIGCVGIVSQAHVSPARIARRSHVLAAVLKPLASATTTLDPWMLRNKSRDCLWPLASLLCWIKRRYEYQSMHSHPSVFPITKANAILRQNAQSPCDQPPSPQISDASYCFRITS